MKMPLNVVRGIFQWCWEEQNRVGHLWSTLS